jgi:hypothetical protein
MSSLSVSADLSPFPPVDVAPKREMILKHIARSERLLAVRPASLLEVRPRPEMFSTGVAQIDAVTGGVPRGCLSEIYGPTSCGKGSVLLAALAAATRRGESCALIDASDSFDPASGAAGGVEFRNLLWVRCGRSEYLQIRARMSVSPKFFVVESRASSPVQNLEQFLKATDLILQSGGFGLVALDLAGIPEKFVRRIPLASWFRFQRAVEHTKTALLVISEIPCAQTCSALVMKLSGKPSALSPQPLEKPAHAEIFEGFRAEAELVHSRLERKPAHPVGAIFSTQAVRAG